MANHLNTQPNKNTENTSKLFILFLCVYFVVWSISPTFLASSVPLDVSEGINWGSEWQWGYYKHPPLSSWILYSFYRIFGHVGPYLLSQLHVLLTLFLVYKLGAKVWSSTTAIIGSVLTLSIVYYTYPSLEFNHNVAQFPIWAGLYLTFYQAVTRNKLSDWVLLGILGGIGMLTKYTVIFLLLPMAFYLLHPKQWFLLKQANPWIAVIVMLAIFTPHLFWLMQNDWLPLSYASARSADASEDASLLAGHMSWIGFTAAQLVAHIPLLVILFLLRKQTFSISTYKQNATPNVAIIWYLWLSPLVLLVGLSLIFGVGLRDMWGMPMWSLSGLLAASLFASRNLLTVKEKIKRYMLLWLTLVTALMAVYIGYGDRIRNKPSRMQWPEQALATQAYETWYSLSRCSMDSVSGNRWLSALIAMNGLDENLVGNDDFAAQMITGAASYSPWMTVQRVQQKGTLVVSEMGEDTVLPLLDQAYTTANTTLIKKEGQWQLDWRNGTDREPLVVNWTAYIPSQCLK